MSNKDLPTIPIDHKDMIPEHQIKSGEHWDKLADEFREGLFKLLTENKLANDLDESGIDALVRSFRRLSEWSYMLRSQPPVIMAAHGPKANPLVAIVQQEERIFRGYLTDFGMNPRSRNGRSDAFKTRPLHGNSKQSNVLKLINGV